MAKANKTKTDTLNRMGQMIRSNKLVVGALVFMAVVASIGLGLEYSRNAEQGGAPLSGATAAPVPEPQPGPPGATQGFSLLSFAPSSGATATAALVPEPQPVTPGAQKPPLPAQRKVQLWEDGPYWATTNIGAEKPEDYGYYFWWGDTVGYNREGNAWVATDGSSSNFSFEASSIPTYNKSIPTLQSEGWIVSQNGINILAPEHDAAQVQWGGKWRMPMWHELYGLEDGCDWTWTTQNGVKGYVVRGRGDYASNSIFLPCAGCGVGTSLDSAGWCGYYWSSLSSSLMFQFGRHEWAFNPYRNAFRNLGFSVRPVQGVAIKKVQLWEDGPYWATTNIGAEKPEDYGYYFWWGDTVGYKREGNAWVAADGSSSYSFFFGASAIPTYKQLIPSLQRQGWIVSQNGINILAPKHDAAQVQWGGKWRMPTYQELSDLNNKCDWTWTTQNGVKGYVVRGRGDYAFYNIFLPCAGYGDDTKGTPLNFAGSHGYYWSSVPYSDSDGGGAYGLYFGSGDRKTDFGGDERNYGQSVRPVQGGAKESGAPYEMNIGAP